MFRIPRAGDEDSPWPIFERLLETHDELADLDRMLSAKLTLAFLFRSGDWGSNGRTTLGKCYLHPSAQGDLRPLFEQLLEDTLGFYPTWLIILNEDWWADASARSREILVFHEALHAGHARDRFGAKRFNRQTGQPIPCVRGHDVEEFTAVVGRYGGWKSDLADFLAAAGAEPATADVF